MGSKAGYVELALNVNVPRLEKGLRAYANCLEEMSDDMDKGVEFAEGIGDEELANEMCITKAKLDDAAISLLKQANRLEAVILDIDSSSIKE